QVTFFISILINLSHFSSTCVLFVPKFGNFWMLCCCHRQNEYFVVDISEVAATLHHSLIHFMDTACLAIYRGGYTTDNVTKWAPHVQNKDMILSTGISKVITATA
ncbi:hypothetical protein ACJX0J_028720, partial [Zea mays]